VKGLVKLGGDCPDLGEEVPGDADEIVMLVVVPDVEGEGVNDAVVGICFLEGVNRPVLRDPARTEGVQQQADGEEGGEEEEEDGLQSEGEEEDVDEQPVREEVEKHGPFEWLWGADESHGLENGKEG